jgi:hypothetical protein
MLWLKQSSRALALRLLANYPLARGLQELTRPATEPSAKSLYPAFYSSNMIIPAISSIAIKFSLTELICFIALSQQSLLIIHRKYLVFPFPMPVPVTTSTNSLRAFHRVACLFAIHVFEDLLGLFDCRTLVDGRRRDELQVVAGKELGPKGACLDKQDANVKVLKFCRKGLGQRCRKM